MSLVRFGPNDWRWVNDAPAVPATGVQDISGHGVGQVMTDVYGTESEWPSWMNPFASTSAVPAGGIGQGMGDQAESERQLSVSASVIGSVIPVVYGSRMVAGAWGHAVEYNSWGGSGTNDLLVTFVFARKTVSSLTTSMIYLNDIVSTSVAWIYDLTCYTGTTSQTKPFSLLLDGGYPGFVYFRGVVYNFANAPDLPAAINARAQIGGTVCQDFRDETTGASSNPVIQAYDVITDGEPWLSLAAYVDATSWETVADNCDAVMGDSTPRYSTNLVVAERNPWAVIAQLLYHCRAHAYWWDGKIRLWQEADAASSLTVRAGDWVRQPGFRVDPPRNERPDAIIVHGSYGDSFEPLDWPVERAEGLSAITGKRMEVQLPGFTDVSPMERWARQELATQDQCGLVWDGGELGKLAANLAPGDVVTAATDFRTTDGTFRVESTVNGLDGRYRPRLRQYADVESSATATMPADHRGEAA